MTGKAKKFAIALNIIITLIMAFLFSATYLMHHQGEKLKGTLEIHTMTDFETKLRAQIGKPYTAKWHNSYVDNLKSDFALVDKCAETLMSFADMVVELSSIVAFCALLNVYLIIRNSRTKSVDIPT